jgi:hypothetical protein
MTDPPDRLQLDRHRDLLGRGWSPWGRRIAMAVLTAFAALGLASVFGQRATSTVVAGSGARLEVSAPERLRGGLLFQARFRIHADEAIDHPAIVLDPGWLEGMTINTIEPAPVDESSDGRRLSLQMAPLKAGDDTVLYMQFQVNPTRVGTRSQDVRLADGSRTLLVADRTVTVFP